MDKKPISISFANQKGGIGKSTLTILAASWLRYVRGLNVLVVDCDFPQNSIVELREREKKAVMKNDAYKLMLQRQFERLQKKAYPVIRSTPENAENDVQVFLTSESEPYDVVLYDLPGTMGTKGVIYTISLLNYLFIPMRADRLVMQSTLNFAQTVYDKFVGNPATNIQEVFLFWLSAARVPSDLRPRLRSWSEMVWVQSMESCLKQLFRWKRQERRNSPEWRKPEKRQWRHSRRSDIPHPRHRRP